MHKLSERILGPHLLNGLVTLPHSLIEGLLLECDLTRLLKVLLAHLLLAGLELGHIGVVTLLDILVSTLQDGLLLQSRDLLLLLDTTQSSVRVLLTSTEVNPTLEHKTFRRLLNSNIELHQLNDVPNYGVIIVSHGPAMSCLSYVSPALLHLPVDVPLVRAARDPDQQSRLEPDQDTRRPRGMPATWDGD